MVENHILEYSPGWDEDAYLVDGRKIKNLLKVTIDGQEYEVTSNTVGVYYADHGSSYTLTHKHYYINLPVVGLFDLKEVVNRKDVIVKEGDYKW